ncbi:MAG: DUF447 family protein [Thermoplasmata archaeon]|nr:DUF447 family protein [Thermoplasmata archaeon]
MPAHGRTDEESEKQIGEEELSISFPEEGAWYEVILTLWRKGKEQEKGRMANASAVGLKRSGSYLGFTLFEGSNSFESIDRNPVVGISVPDIPGGMDIFIRASLYGCGDDELEFEPGDYKIVDTSFGEAPVVNACPVKLVLRIEKIAQKDHLDRLGEARVKQVRGAVVSVEREEKETRAYSRGSAHIIEALITATRYLATGKKEMLKMAEGHLRSAEKAGGKETSRMVGKIRSRLYSSSSIIE